MNGLSAPTAGETSAEAVDPNEDDPDNRRRPGRSSKGSYRMLGKPDDEILAFVRWAYLDLGEPQFTKLAYQRWRRKLIEVFDSPLPSAEQLVVRFGSFTEAAQRAIPDLPRRGLRLARRPAAGHTPALLVDAAAEDASPAAAGSEPFHGLKVLQAIAGELTRPELQELERLLRRRLSKWESKASERRTERLAFLARLLAEQPTLTEPFRAVARKTYDELRPSEAPTSERLVRAYGSWFMCCRAADGLTRDGRKSAPGGLNPRSLRARPKQPPYTRDEVIGAVQQCAATFAARRLPATTASPSSQDYHRWSIERCAHARANGQSLRLPKYSTIVRIFRPETEPGQSVWSAVVTAAGL